MTEDRPSRHAASLALADDLLSDIELSRLAPPQLVLKASRLARLARDDEAQRWLGFEISGYTFDGTTNDLFTRSGRWADDERTKAYTVPLAEIFAIASAERAKLATLQGTTFGANTAFATAQTHQAMIGNATANISRMAAIEGKVVGAIYSWATPVLHELLFSDLQADLFAAAQSEIDSRLIPLSDTALEKIEVISERLRAGDHESVSNAMSTIRRLITTAADALFPPRQEPYRLGEQEISVRANAVLNRLKAYAAECEVAKGRRDRLSRTLHDIWERSSAGDHSDIDPVEARYLFLQTYIVLGELLALTP